LNTRAKLFEYTSFSISMHVVALYRSTIALIWLHANY